MKHLKNAYRTGYIIEFYSYEDETQYALLVKEQNGRLVESAYGFETLEQAEQEVKRGFDS